MRTKQQIVTYSSRIDFQRRVQHLLDEGWRIVPTTLVASVSCTPDGVTYGVFACVLEVGEFV